MLPPFEQIPPEEDLSLQRQEPERTGKLEGREIKIASRKESELKIAKEFSEVHNDSMPEKTQGETLKTSLPEQLSADSKKQPDSLTIVQIPEEKLSSIKEKTPRLHAFLTDEGFEYRPMGTPDYDYDMEFEDYYGVGNITPQQDENDKEFISTLRKKYAKEFARIEGKSIDLSGHNFSIDERTRLADSDIAQLYHQALNEDPAIKNILREGLAYAINKSFVWNPPLNQENVSSPQENDYLSDDRLW